MFRIVILTDTKTGGEEFSELDYGSILKRSYSDSFLGFLRKSWVEKCIAEKAVRCPFPIQSYATAFLARDQRSIWTVRHVFDEWIFENLEKIRASGIEEFTEVQSALSNKPVQFLLYDEALDLVYDSRKNEPASFEFVGNPSFMERSVFEDFARATDHIRDKNVHKWDYVVKPSIVGKLTDFAVLHLPIKLSLEPLRFSTTTPEVGDPVEITGYPKRTDKNSSAHNKFDGSSQYTVKGSVVSAIEILANSNQIQDLQLHASAIQLIRTFEEKFLYHDIPYAVGMSGAPILDEHGDVISIQSSGNSKGGFGLERQWIEKLLLQFQL